MAVAVRPTVVAMPGGVSMLLRPGLAGVARRVAAAGGLLRVAAVRIAGALVGGMPLRVPGIVIVTAGVVAAGVPGGGGKKTAPAFGSLVILP